MKMRSLPLQLPCTTKTLLDRQLQDFSPTLAGCRGGVLSVGSFFTSVIAPNPGNPYFYTILVCPVLMCPLKAEPDATICSPECLNVI